MSGSFVTNAGAGVDRGSLFKEPQGQLALNVNTQLVEATPLELKPPPPVPVKAVPLQQRQLAKPTGLQATLGGAFGSRPLVEAWQQPAVATQQENGQNPFPLYRQNTVTGLFESDLRLKEAFKAFKVLERDIFGEDKGTTPLRRAVYDKTQEGLDILVEDRAKRWQVFTFLLFPYNGTQFENTPATIQDTRDEQTGKTLWEALDEIKPYYLEGTLQRLAMGQQVKSYLEELQGKVNNRLELLQNSFEIVLAWVFWQALPMTTRALSGRTVLLKPTLPEDKTFRFESDFLRILSGILNSILMTSSGSVLLAGSVLPYANNLLFEFKKGRLVPTGLGALRNIVDDLEKTVKELPFSDKVKRGIDSKVRLTVQRLSTYILETPIQSGTRPEDLLATMSLSDALQITLSQRSPDALKWVEIFDVFLDFVGGYENLTTQGQQQLELEKLKGGPRFPVSSKWSFQGIIFYPINDEDNLNFFYATLAGAGRLLALSVLVESLGAIFPEVYVRINLVEKTFSITLQVREDEAVEFSRVLYLYEWDNPRNESALPISGRVWTRGDTRLLLKFNLVKGSIIEDFLNALVDVDKIFHVSKAYENLEKGSFITLEGIEELFESSDLSSLQLLKTAQVFSRITSLEGNSPESVIRNSLVYYGHFIDHIVEEGESLDLFAITKTVSQTLTRIPHVFGQDVFPAEVVLAGFSCSFTFTQAVVKDLVTILEGFGQDGSVIQGVLERIDSVLRENSEDANFPLITAILISEIGLFEVEKLLGGEEESTRNFLEGILLNSPLSLLEGIFARERPNGSWVKAHFMNWKGFVESRQISTPVVNLVNSLRQDAEIETDIEEESRKALNDKASDLDYFVREETSTGKRYLDYEKVTPLSGVDPILTVFQLKNSINNGESRILEALYEATVFADIGASYLLSDTLEEFKENSVYTRVNEENGTVTSEFAVEHSNALKTLAGLPLEINELGSWQELKRERDLQNSLQDPPQVVQTQEEEPQEELQQVQEFPPPPEGFATFETEETQEPPQAQPRVVFTEVRPSQEPLQLTLRRQPTPRSVTFQEQAQVQPEQQSEEEEDPRESSPYTDDLTDTYI